MAYNKEQHLKFLRNPYQSPLIRKTALNKPSSELLLLRKKIKMLNTLTIKTGDYVSNKCLFKRKIEGIAKVPRVYYCGRDLGTFRTYLAQLEEVVMKPNHLSRGIGVRVLKRNGDLFTDINGDTLTISDLANEAEILLGLGKYKGGSRIILEERIRAHPDFDVDDIPDIRMIYYRNKFLFCVARMPSRESQGYANISRGATCGIVLNSGRYINNDARFQNNSILSGELPFFEDLVSTGKRVTQVFGIAFQSVDMTVNERGDVVVIESDSLPQSISDDRLTLQGIDWLNAVMGNDLNINPTKYLLISNWKKVQTQFLRIGRVISRVAKGEPVRG